MAWERDTKYNDKYRIGVTGTYYLSWNDLGQFCLFFNYAYITSGTKAECSLAFKQRLKKPIDIVSNL